MNAAPISVNLAAGGDASSGAAGQAGRASTLPAFAQVMAQKQTEASAPKDKAAATSGTEKVNAASESAGAVAQGSSASVPVNAKSHTTGTADTAKKGDAKGKSSNDASAGKSVAQTPAQMSPPNPAGNPPLLPALNGATPWVAPVDLGNAQTALAEPVINGAVSAATPTVVPTDATGARAVTTNASLTDGAVAQEQEPTTGETTKPIAADLGSSPVSALSAPVVSTTTTVTTTTTAESGGTSVPGMEAANGMTIAPAAASSIEQKHAETRAVAPAVTTSTEPAVLMDGANVVAAPVVQSTPAEGNDPVTQNAPANSGNIAEIPTVAATSKAKAGDFTAGAAAALPVAPSEGATANAHTAPKNQGKWSVQEILRGAAALAGKDAQAAVRVSMNAAKDVVSAVTGKRVGSGGGTRTAPASVVGAKNESPVSLQPDPVTPEIAEVPEKRGAARAGSNIKGNSSVDAIASGNSDRAGSAGDSKDSGFGGDSSTVHSPMSVAQNDPSNLAASAASTVPAQVAIASKDSSSTMPAKSGDASNNGASAVPDADDAAPQPNESRVVNVAQLAGDQGHSQVRIAMQADQLGQVELHATVRGQQVGAAITVEKKEAHAAMAAEMPSLQQALEDRQLRVGEVVLMQGVLHSTAGDAGNAAAEQQRRGQAGTTYQQVENETMYEARMGTNFESSGIFDDSGRLSVRA